MRGLKAFLGLAVASACYSGVAAFFAGSGVFQGVKVVHMNSRSAAKTTPLTKATTRRASTIVMSNTKSKNYNRKVASDVARVLAAFLAGASLTLGSDAAIADGATKKFSLPPISKVKDRCMFKSSAMGQANAARDSLYDLRECTLSGKSAAGFDLSGVIASDADFSETDFKEVVMSKAYARNSKWDGADFTNAVVDRVSFDGSSLKGAIFKNAVLTSTSFEGANVQDADFTEAYMGDFDLRTLCKNPTLRGTNPVTNADTRESLGCPGP